MMDKLRFDDPVVCPDPPPSDPSSSDTLPLSDYISALVFEKSMVGYRIEDVDSFFEELRRDLSDGCDIPADRIRNAVFHKASFFKAGYSMPDVDAALDQITKRIEDQTAR